MRHSKHGLGRVLKVRSDGTLVVEYDSGETHWDYTCEVEVVDSTSRSVCQNIIVR